MPAHTLLHLTDLHLGASAGKGHYWNSEATELQLAEHDRRGLLGSLVRDLRRQKVTPDLVIVTGDLLERGGAEGVPMAVELLGGLCDKFALPRRRVVLIPGNHDVLRSPDPRARYASFDAICRAFYGQDVTGFVPETPPYRRVARHDFSAEMGIEVVGFNSCEALDAATGQEHGSVGAAQRDRAEELLDGTEGKGLIRLAAMHHHLACPAGVVRNDYSVMDDAALTFQWLAQRRFHLVLHGHQHVDWQEVREIDGWSIAVAAGASAGVASYGRKEWDLRLGYQIIVLEGTSGGRRIRREYDPQTREWIAAGKGAAEQALRFGHAGAGHPGAPPSSTSRFRECIIELVSTVRWERRALLWAYACSAQGERRRAFEGDTSEDLAARMLRALFPMTRQVDGTFPWLTFVWHLVTVASAPGTPPEVNRLTEPLSDHFDTVTSSLGFAPDMVDAWKRRVEDDRERIERIDLHVIIVAHKRLERSTYLVRAFRALVPRGAETWTDHDIVPLEVPGGDDREVRDAGELAALARELFSTLDADFGRAEDSTVELFVPLRLLGCDVDQWLVDDGFGETRIGHQHKVVARSWERTYGGRQGSGMQKWRSHWARLFQSAPGSIWYCGPEDAQGMRLKIPQDHPACVVMRMPPSVDPTDGTSRALAELIRGGSVVAVWPRKTVQSAAELESFVSSQLPGSSIDRWRDEVRAFRKRAMSCDDPSEHPGSHLTLLWDDPNKLPPDAPHRDNMLRAPTRTKGPAT